MTIKFIFSGLVFGLLAFAATAANEQPEVTLFTNQLNWKLATGGDSITDANYLKVLSSSSPNNYGVFAFDTAVLAVGYNINSKPSNLGSCAICATDEINFNLPATAANGVVDFAADAPLITTSAGSAKDEINLQPLALPLPEPSVTALVVAGVIGIGLTKRRCGVV